MFIIEMTAYESDFIDKNTELSGAYQIRTFDVNHSMSLFAYYYEDYIHLKLRRYGEIETSVDDWKQLKHVGLLYPDINLHAPLEVMLDLEEDQLHVKVPRSIYKKE